MEPPLPSSTRRAALFVVLALALVLRLAHWWAVRGQPFFAWPVMDSQEYDRWAREIAGGDWLGSQVFFQAPLYPYLLAVLYALAGRSLDAVYLAQIAVAVAGCWALYRAGREMAGDRVGIAAAALAAVYGPFLFYDVQILKESLAVAAAAFLLWALATARERRGAGRWLGAGALLGVLALLRENALLVAPFLLPLAWSRRQGRRRSLAAGGALLAGMALVLAPVALRNGLVGGDFLPTTFQGGVNFYIGNNPAADGTYRPIVPGKQIPALERREPVRLAEQATGRRLTPSEVSRFWLGKALSWAAAHPGAFLRLQLRKLGMFWSWYEWPDAVDYYSVRELSPVLRLPLLEFGGAALLALLGLWRIRRRPGPFAPALLFAGAWTVSTILFFLFSRYRLPAVPALLLLAAVPVAGLPAAWRERRAGGAARARALGLALACVLALALPRLVGFSPRMDLVHYNLARLAEERGDPAAAREHYRAVLAIDPDDFLACLNLGNQAARAGDWAAALALYSRAAALEPGSDDAQSNLGGIDLVLGRLAEAAEHLDRALALNPENRTALQNAALLHLRRGDLAAARALNRRLLALDPANPAALRLRDRLERAGAPSAPSPPVAAPPAGTRRSG
jgi:tetratricopeptide (TPR) repeat protein